MQTCYENSRLAIKLEQRADLTFRVTYGLQVTDNLCYQQAAVELGACIMHALACEGLLDNSGD